MAAMFRRPGIRAHAQTPVAAGVLGERVEVLGAIALDLRASRRFMAARLPPPAARLRRLGLLDPAGEDDGGGSEHRWVLSVQGFSDKTPDRPGLFPRRC
jgi:hypothetical protein